MFTIRTGILKWLPNRRGTTPVGRIHRSYVDAERTDWDGRDPRPLETTIWYPAAAGSREVAWKAGVFHFGHVAPNAPFADEVPHPLILLSHGTGGSAAQLSWLAQQLVMAGFVVASVNHHGNTATEPAYRLHGFVLPWERACDLSVLIDKLAVDPGIGPHIDMSRIGAAGFSLGGYTVLALAGAHLTFAEWQQKCASEPNAAWCALPPEAPFTLADVDALAREDDAFRASLTRSEQPTHDARIQAVFAMAPALVPALNSASLQTIHVPVQVMLGSEDTQVLPELTAGILREFVTGARVELLPGVAHYAFLAPCTGRGRLFVSSLCKDGGARRRAVHAMAGQVATKFFNEHLLAINGER